MRSTNQIVIAVQECQPCTDEELRLCIMALHCKNYNATKAADDMAEAIDEGKPSMRLRSKFWKNNVESRFQAMKMPVDKYLGSGNIPGTPEHDERMRLGKAIFKKATGLDL